MPSLPLYDMNKKEVGKVDLNDGVFAGEVKAHLINDAVRYQMAKWYEQRTALCRNRTEISGTRKKTYRQKGTGQARHGDQKAPTFAGGGKAHGPHPRLVIRKLNKKVRRAALVSALSMHQQEDRLFVVDKLELDKMSAKAVAKCLSAFGLESALVVNTDDSAKAENFNRSSRNISKVKFLKPEGINVFDILKYKNVVLSKKAAESIAERLNHA
jgi:large subunit ribosomal protein L4